MNESCEHELDGMVYLSNPPQFKCKKCGQFYRETGRDKFNREVAEIKEKLGEGLEEFRMF